MLVPVRFNVFGDPATQAGTKSVPIKKNGQTVGYRKITEGGVNLKSWRQEVSSAAALAVPNAGGMYSGPVRLDVVFRFPMPKSRALWMKAQGVALRSTKPDVDKLVRAICDSLKSGGLIADDALVCMGRIAKVEVFEQWTGATLRVGPLDQRTFMAELREMMT